MHHIPYDEERLQQKLLALTQEHQDLDRVIAQLQQSTTVDEFLLARMKKRKLALKDTITHLNSQLIPDLNA